MTEPIFHLADPVDWARGTDEYRPVSLEEQGFIHCSTADQISGVARSLYIDANDLILLTVDLDALDDGALVFEDLYGEGVRYPHVYGALPHSAVIGTGPYLEHLEEGMWSERRWDRSWMDRMLHPDFDEVGRSGRVHDRESTIAADPEPIDVDLPLGDYRLERIDGDVAVARYVTHVVRDGTTESSQRTSIWVNTNDGWRLRFHQGTPAP